MNEEIRAKAEKIAKIAGIKNIDKIQKELENEFDPQEYDKDMNEAFDEEYYQEQEEEVPEGQDPELEISDINLEEIDENQEKREDVWWSCDGCFKAIKPGKLRFDCKECENFTFCEKCFEENESHAHTFKKKKVKPDFKPPKNATQLISKAFEVCSQCKNKIQGVKYVD